MATLKDPLLRHRSKVAHSPFPPRVELPDHHGPIQSHIHEGGNSASRHSRARTHLSGHGAREAPDRRARAAGTRVPCPTGCQCALTRSLHPTCLGGFDPSLTLSIYLFSATPTHRSISANENQPPCSVPPPSHKRHATPRFPTPCSTRQLRYAFLVRRFPSSTSRVGSGVCLSWMISVFWISGCGD